MEVSHSYTQKLGAQQTNIDESNLSVATSTVAPCMTVGKGLYCACINLSLSLVDFLWFFLSLMDVMACQPCSAISLAGLTPFDANIKVVRGAKWKGGMPDGWAYQQELVDTQEAFASLLGL